MSEFDLINQFFRSMPQQRNDVVLGIGDDCAILQVPEGKQLVVSTDTLVSGVHFPAQTAARDIGYKSLAVNLSDLAAMGADPAWVTLCLTLPENDPVWLEGFVKGFSELLVEHKLQLVGGDTTHGPLSISVHVSGFVQPEKVMRRDRAQPGDLVYVTGTIGDAGLGLEMLKKNSSEKNTCVIKLNRPEPRNYFALALKEFCHCAIDVSDGLLADLQHICDESHCGAELLASDIPLSNELKEYYGGEVDVNKVLTAGDDYELCFTVNEKYNQRVLEISKETGLQTSCIGKITEGSHVVCLDEHNAVIETSVMGYEHF
ncbi:MAG: thiamine-phosphate kinase [Gammaproteobacteria bacterium]|nr:thiamine-phosphate kinase [Gammaproteobacteria bacterium]